MICPNCGHDQDDRWLSCHNCHVIFSKMGITPPPAASSPRPESQILDAVIFLLLIANVILALIWVNIPNGEPVMAGAYRNGAVGFALNPPQGWQVESASKINQRLYRLHRIPLQSVSSLDRDLVMYVGFVNYLDESEFPPYVSVAVLFRALPWLDETAIRPLVESLQLLMGSFLEGYRLESMQVVSVDGLRALRIAYTGDIITTAAASKKSSDSFDRQNITLPLKAQLVLIPGRNRTFLLNFMAISRQYDMLGAEFNWFLKTFRVLKRPVRIAPGLHELFELCLVALFFYSFNALRKLVFPKYRQ